MAVPQQVQDMADKADEMLKQQNETEKPDDSANPEDNPPDKEKNPDAGDDPPDKLDETQPPEPPSGDTPPAEDNEALKQRLKVVQGMLDKRNSEFRNLERTLNADVVQRDRQIQELKNRIAALEKPAGPEPPKPLDYSTLLSPEDVEALEDEDLGPKAMKIITALATQVATNVTKPLAESVSQTQETIKQNTNTVLQQRADAFFSKLNAAVPDWEDVNQNSDWNAWLLERVPGTDYTRQDIIDDAQKKLNPTNIINLLNDFKEIKQGIQPPPADNNNNPDPDNPAPQPQPKTLDDVVEPVVPSNQPITNPATDKIWSKSEINKFYADVTRGAYKSNPEAATAVEQAILKASLDGRVQP